MSEIKVVVRMNEEQKAYCVGRARESGVSVQQWALCKLMEDSVIPVVPEKEVSYGLKPDQDKVSGKGVGGETVGTVVGEEARKRGNKMTKKEKAELLAKGVEFIGHRGAGKTAAQEEKVKEFLKKRDEDVEMAMTQAGPEKIMGEGHLTPAEVEKLFSESEWDGKKFVKKQMVGTDEVVDGDLPAGNDEVDTCGKITAVPDSEEYLTVGHLVYSKREVEKAERFAGAYGPEKRVLREQLPPDAKFTDPEPFPGTKYVPVGQDKFVPPPMKVDAYMPVKQVVSRPVAMQTDCYLKEEAPPVDKKIAMPNGVKTARELDSF